MTKKQTTFYCFSPPVMIITFLIEISMVIYVLWRYKLNPVSRIAVLILTMLATFQLAEYMVCAGPTGTSTDIWARIGFAAITLLPPLGIHLSSVLAGKKNQRLLVPAYGLAILFIGFFLFYSNAFVNKVCAGNYVIFNIDQSADLLYGLYYYGLLVVGAAYAWAQANRASSLKKKRALKAFSIGYILFMLPTATVNIIIPESIQGIPSIMCGFAVILAIIIAFWVLPASVDRRSIDEK